MVEGGGVIDERLKMRDKRLWQLLIASGIFRAFRTF